MEIAFHIALMLEADSQNCQDSIDTISYAPLILYFLILHKTRCLLPKFFMN